jgi:hypothetical protein
MIPLASLYLQGKTDTFGTYDEFRWLIGELSAWLGHEATIADAGQINDEGLEFFEWLQGRRCYGRLCTVDIIDYAVDAVVHLLAVARRERRKVKRQSAPPIDAKAFYTVTDASAF